MLCELLGGTLEEIDLVQGPKPHTKLTSGECDFTATSPATTDDARYLKRGYSPTRRDAVHGVVFDPFWFISKGAMFLLRLCLGHR